MRSLRLIHGYEFTTLILRFRIKGTFHARAAVRGFLPKCLGPDGSWLYILRFAIGKVLQYWFRRSVTPWQCEDRQHLSFSELVNLQVQFSHVYTPRFRTSSTRAHAHVAATDRMGTKAALRLSPARIALRFASPRG